MQCANHLRLLLAAALLAWLLTHDSPRFPGSLHATNLGQKRPPGIDGRLLSLRLHAWLLAPDLNMASKTLRQAEKKALEGANESQDTLMVAHCLMREFGVGLVSLLPILRETWPGRGRLTLGALCREAARLQQKSRCLSLPPGEAGHQAREAAGVVSISKMIN